MKPSTFTHWLWRTATAVTRLSYPNRHNGQTCLVKTETGEVVRVSVDDLQTHKEYFA